jgi:hypothetical protein
MVLKFTQQMKQAQIIEKYIQYALRILARNHSGPTSVKSRKYRRNLKIMSVLTPRNAQEK